MRCSNIWLKRLGYSLYCSAMCEMFKVKHLARQRRLAIIRGEALLHIHTLINKLIITISGFSPHFFSPNLSKTSSLSLFQDLYHQDLIHSQDQMSRNFLGMYRYLWQLLLCLEIVRGNKKYYTGAYQ